jgi:hypothetical protein
MPPVPTGVNVLAVFFVFGAGMAGLASLSLLFPGGALEPMWQLKPEARTHLASLGPIGVGLMAMVSIACAGAALGLRSLAGWGHKLAVALLGVNLLGDAANAIFAHDLRTLIGIPIGGVLIAYLLQPQIRALFGWRDLIPRGPS